MDRAAAPQSAIVLPYYGWYVLAASALTEMLVTGATAYASGLFVIPLESEFGLSRADASSSVPILFLGSLFFSPFAGRILDRYPIRWGIGAGAFCFSLALAVVGLTHNLWIMTLALLLPAAMGVTILGPMTTATLASRWFFKRRGLALGIAAVATSAGGFVVVPLLSKAIQVYGWHNALVGEAVVMFLVITALAIFVLRDNPFKMGLADHSENKGRSDGAQFLNPNGPEIAGHAIPWHGILRHRGFWAPSLLIAIISAVSQTIVVSAPPYGHQLGFTLAASAFLISGFSVAAAATKIAAGVMADLWNTRILLFATALFMPLALASLFFFANYGAILAACCLAGIALGGVLPTSASLIAARFGAARFGSVIGWTYVLVFGSTIAAVRFMGSVFDHTGSYHPAFAALLVFSILVWLVCLVIDTRAGKA